MFDHKQTKMIAIAGMTLHATLRAAEPFLRPYSHIGSKLNEEAIVLRAVDGSGGRNKNVGLQGWLFCHGTLNRQAPSFFHS